MSIKSIVLMTLAATVVLTTAAAEGGKKKGKRGGLPTGGFLEVANTGKVVQVVNVGGAGEAKAFASAVDFVSQQLPFPVVTTARSIAGKRDVEAVARVTVVSKADAPMLICAPDEGWAEVNVRPLAEDGANDFIQRTRLQKAVVRAMCYALGCGNSSVQPCVMTEVNAPGDLDKLAKVMSPETVGKVFCTARNRGGMPRQYASYRKACQEGWAPAPTNDIQKAIWDKVHAMPTAPLKIKPETKKVAE